MTNPTHSSLNAQRRGSSFLLGLSLLTLLMISASSACHCDKGGGLNTSAPNIAVHPDPLAFGTVPMLEESALVLVIENTGNQDLTLQESPVLVENSEDSSSELVLRKVLLPVNCATGEERTDATPLTLTPGECSSITVVYRPQNLGPDTGSLTLGSNDPDTPSLVVPITAEGSAPDIEVCLLKSACSPSELCSKAGDPALAMNFPLAQIGNPQSCPVRITNTGALPLTRLAWTFKAGNRRRDYSLDDDPLSASGSLDPGQQIETSITFTPKSGGPKDALVEIDSSDPDEAAVVIELSGMGDGPKVCPDPFPLVDFGKVEVGSTASLEVQLTDCGTLPMDVTKLEIQDGNGLGPSAEFALGAGAPAVPLTLAAAASVPVPIEFTPPRAGPFTGRLYLETSDPVVPSGWLNIVGEGSVPPACQLQASTTVVNFGATAPSTLGGSPLEKTIALANPGELPCSGVEALISAGSAVSFSIVGLPPGGSPWTLNSGDILVFTLRYDPADTSGPDTGVLSFSSPDDPTQIDVQLQGTPVAVPACQLNVLPKTGNFTLGFCSILGGLNPRVVQFGASPMGLKKTLPITLENVGSATCTISKTTVSTFNPANPFGGSSPAISLDAPPDQILVAGAPSQTLNPGEVGTLPITFLPLNEEQACGSVEIETSEASFAGECLDLATGLTRPGCYRLNVMGTGVRALLQVVPVNLEFGVITVGCASAERDVTLHNTGQATINITRLDVDPVGTPFSLTSAPPLPFPIAAGTSLTVKIRYQPPDANPHAANLIIESDDPTSPLVTVPLTGTGTNDPHQTDLFQQLSEPQVDVLWVIDNSCSMSGEQNNVAQNANTFLSHALSLQTDFQVGVVTTDMEDSGQSGLLRQGGFYGSAPKIIDRSTADPVGAFSNSVRQGTMGSATEQGLAAANAALTFPLINDPALNGSFLRPDAKLTMIVISDEEDSSPATVDYYVDAFKVIKGYRRPDLMSFSAVVGPEPSGCSSSVGAAGAGTRYLEVARRTGGLERSICTADWGQLADDLGLDAFGAKSDFYLSREAIEATIEVRVDGVLVPKTGNWSYEPASNSVAFDATATPAQGAEVKIDYDTLCR